MIKNFHENKFFFVPDISRIHSISSHKSIAVHHEPCALFCDRGRLKSKMCGSGV
jgi:hypothetical protein